MVQVQTFWDLIKSETGINFILLTYQHATQVPVKPYNNELVVSRRNPKGILCTQTLPLSCKDSLNKCPKKKHSLPLSNLSFPMHLKGRFQG